MILVWGSSSDPPVERILSELQERGAPVLHVDENTLSTMRYDITLGAVPAGWIEVQGRRVRIEELAGIYLRPGESVPGSSHAASMILLGVASGAAATVVNRPSAGRSNWSKPYQLALIASQGFSVPDTLVTTDPLAALEFLNKHRRVVYKSVSGIRSIVATLAAANVADVERLQAVASGPVQFQRWIAGRDVRVHVVGERCFATAIDSSLADYRYAPHDGPGAEVAVSAIEIPDALAARLVALTRHLGLLVAGIDLRVSGNGEWFCFEVNPSPGFTFYEDAAGQPISEAIADLLLDAPSGDV